jgi:hypothetical protein
MERSGRAVFVRVFALVTSWAYLLTGGGGGYAAESLFWSERRRSIQHLEQPAQRIPTSERTGSGGSNFFGGGTNASRWGALEIAVRPFGDVRGVHESALPGAPLVFHIQDIHGNPQAQRNMAKMVLALQKVQGVRLVGLEGATGPFSTAEFADYPDPAPVQQVAAFFVEKGLLGGPEGAALSAPRSLTLWGIEDPSLYHANIIAVKKALSLRRPLTTFLTSVQASLATLSSAHFSNDLRAFDQNRAAFEEGRCAMGTYLQTLASLDPHPNPPLARSAPHIARLLSLLKTERALDFDAVEKERRALMDRVAGKLSPGELQRLCQTRLELPQGKIAHRDDQRLLKQLCSLTGIPLNQFPHLSSYLDNLTAGESIDRETLVKEMGRWENSVQSALVRSPLQHKVVDLSSDARLLQKLINNEMSPEDWASYMQRRGDLIRLPERIATLTGTPLRWPAPPEKILRPFEAFCRRAVDRNGPLADRLLRKMTREKESRAVLVAGGFHTAGIVQTLRARGASVIVLTPRLGPVNPAQRYLDVFAQTPPPFENIFAGEPFALKSPCGLAENSPASVRDPLHAGIVAVDLATRGHSWKEWGTRLGELKKYVGRLAERRMRIQKSFHGLFNLTYTDPLGATNTLHADRQGSRWVFTGSRSIGGTPFSLLSFKTLKRVIHRLSLFESLPNPATTDPVVDQLLEAYQSGNLDDFKKTLPEEFDGDDLWKNMDETAESVVKSKIETAVWTLESSVRQFRIYSSKTVNAVVVVPTVWTDTVGDTSPKNLVKSFRLIKNHMGPLAVPCTLVWGLHLKLKSGPMPVLPFAFVRHKVRLLSDGFPDPVSQRSTNSVPPPGSRRQNMLAIHRARQDALIEFFEILRRVGLHIPGKHQQRESNFGFLSDRLVLINFDGVEAIGDPVPDRVEDVFNKEVRAQQQNFLIRTLKRPVKSPSSPIAEKEGEFSLFVLTVVMPLMETFLYQYSTARFIAVIGLDPSGLSVGLALLTSTAVGFLSAALHSLLWTLQNERVRLRDFWAWWAGGSFFALPFALGGAWKVGTGALLFGLSAVPHIVLNAAVALGGFKKWKPFSFLSPAPLPAWKSPLSHESLSEIHAIVQWYSQRILALGPQGAAATESIIAELPGFLRGGDDAWLFAVHLNGTMDVTIELGKENFLRRLTERVPALIHLDGLPHTEQLVDCSLGRENYDGLPYLVTVSPPGQRVNAMGKSEGGLTTEAIMRRILSFPANHIQDLHQTVTWLLGSGFVVSPARVYYDKSAGFTLADVGVNDRRQTPQPEALELTSRILGAAPNTMDLGDGETALVELGIQTVRAALPHPHVGDSSPAPLRKKDVEASLVRDIASSLEQNEQSDQRNSLDSAFLNHLIPSIYARYSEEAKSHIHMAKLFVAGAVTCAAMKSNPKTKVHVLAYLKTANSLDDLLAINSDPVDTEFKINAWATSHFHLPVQLDKEELKKKHALFNRSLMNPHFDRIRGAAPAEGHDSFPSVEPIPVPRVLPLELTSVLRDRLMLNPALLGGPSPKVWWDVRLGFRETGPGNPTNVRAFKEFLRDLRGQERAPFASPLPSQRVALTAWENGVDLVVRARTPSDFQNGLRALALVELELATATRWDKLKPDYWALLSEEKKVWGPSPASTEERLSRAAVLCALLRTAGDSITLEGRSAHQRDVDLLLGAAGAAPGEWKTHFDAVRNSYNGFLEHAVKIDLWREFLRLEWPLAHPRREVRATVTDRGVHLFFIDALIPGAEPNENVRREVLAALAGLLLSVRKEELSQKVFLVTSQGRVDEARARPFAEDLARELSEGYGPLFERLRELTVVSPENNVKGLFSNGKRGPIVHMKPLVSHLFGPHAPTSIEVWTPREENVDGGGLPVNIIPILKLAEHVMNLLKQQSFIHLFA